MFIYLYAKRATEKLNPATAFVIWSDSSWSVNHIYFIAILLLSMKRKRSTAAGHEIVYSYNQFDCIVGNFMNDHQAKG